MLAGIDAVVTLTVDRPFLREWLCRIAGRDLTVDEETVFLRESRYRDYVRCTG